MKTLSLVALAMIIVTFQACSPASNGSASASNNAAGVIAQQTMFTKWYDRNGALAWDFTGMSLNQAYPYVGTCGAQITITQGQIRIPASGAGCENFSGYFYMWSMNGTTLTLCDEHSSPFTCADYFTN